MDKLQNLYLIVAKIMLVCSFVLLLGFAFLLFLRSGACDVYGPPSDLRFIMDDGVGFFYDGKGETPSEPQALLTWIICNHDII